MATIRSKSIRSSKSTNAPSEHLAPPPSTAAVPTPPEGFAPSSGNPYRGVSPKSYELKVMKDAVAEIQRFSDYGAVFGKTAPPHAAVAQTFDAAQKWSTMRTKTDAWGDYCRDREGAAWQAVRALTDRLQRAFELAVKGDPAIGAANPALVSLFSGAKILAQRGAMTRKANQKLEAEGKRPTKGSVGKRRERKAARAALAALDAASTSAPPATAEPAQPSGVHAAAPNGAATSSGAPH